MVAGNWKDPKFLEGKIYDVVVADYLLGILLICSSNDQRIN